MRPIIPYNKNNMRTSIYLMCFATLAMMSAHALQPSSPHARAELLAKSAAAQPGTDLELGIHFSLEPGWHIYWINPGDSGQPPSLKWQLPAGFSAGEIEWPRPERMQPAAQLTDYGYHGDVLLPVTLHVPAKAAAGSSIEISAEAKWLVCREVCIPEKAQLHLALPVAASAKENSSFAALFARTEKLLPKELPRTWKARAKSEKDAFILSIYAGRRISKAEFLPLDPDQIDNPAPQKLQPQASGVRITLKKSDLLTKPITMLRGVLELPDGIAYRIEAPVQEPLK
jgi:DsbC/DsbD-like thiol-disulfide interchange protein